MSDLKVLSLVTNDGALFYKQQVEVLEAKGVEVTTLAVPGRDTKNQEWTARRSVADYLRFYPTVLRHSFDDYDLVHANYGLTAPAALAQPNLPVVLSLWGSDVFGTYGKYTRWCSRRVDAVIVMSDVMARELDADCFVIPHGIDLDMFRPVPHDSAQESLGWSPDAKHVLFPYSTSREVKNYPRAKRVVEAVRERYVGPVELQVLSGVPHEQMADYMSAADVLLLTSRHEGSPNTVKEALACNLPVVSTDVGDVRERVSGVANCYVGATDEELVDGMLAVLERGERSDGRQAARELSLDRMGDQIIDVYRQVLGEETQPDSPVVSST